MSESRDGSPDWLREFQPPSDIVVTIPSESDSSRESSPNVFAHADKVELSKHQVMQDSIQIDTDEDSAHVSVKKSTNTKTENDKFLSQVIDTLKESKVGQTEADKPEKHAGPQVSNRLPLVFTEKVQRSKALVECDGDSIDLSGDVGAVGRIVISNGPVGNHEMFLDLKGTVYKTRIVPSRTFCVVSIGQSEAKVEAIMNDFIQLDPQSNVFEAETMVEGTLDGFSFDSEEEVDRLTKISAKISAPQTDQQNENADHTDRKTKDPVHKKAKTAAKSDKRGTKKSQVSKRTKKSKK